MNANLTQLDSSIFNGTNADIAKISAENITEYQKKQIIGLSKTELANELNLIGEKSYRAEQIWHFIYNKGIRDFADMTNISKKLRIKLDELFDISRPAIIKDLKSSDKTRKWLIEFGKNQQAETVHIPESDRGSLCVSSQVGCTLNCSFCHTGTQKLVKNVEKKLCS